MENQFIDLLKEVLEVSELSLSDNFKELNEWDSLALLTLIAELDEQYGVLIESDELDKIQTVQELFDLVQNKKN
ncbi:acyl carrier protein [Cyclobacterium xiamenense]|uniref:acyl carrier protein n=1 Tax=Cyclobacterium xiamenense TaxID=1297121 RepID=UPI0035CFE652